MSDIIKDTKSRMQKSIDNLSRELANISAGRANSNLLNGVTVDYYGAPTPVQQLASINVPEARLLVISPYDKSSVADIEKASRLILGLIQRVMVRLFVSLYQL